VLIVKLIGRFALAGCGTRDLGPLGRSTAIAWMSVALPGFGSIIIVAANRS
jgi:hypothetical protein